MRKVLYTAAIESGIGGGSVSILEKGEILDFFKGCDPSGKADDLLEEFSALLKKNGIKKTEISKIKYSEYPGSHTGLKIGASIAKGLHIALNAEVESKNLFECIYKTYSKKFVGDILIILPVSRTDFVWRFYNKKGEPEGSGQGHLEKVKTVNFCLGRKDDLKVLIPVILLKNMEQVFQKFEVESRYEIVTLDENLSVYLG